MPFACIERRRAYQRAYYRPRRSDILEGRRLMPACQNCEQPRPCVRRLRDDDTGDAFDLCHECRINPDFPISPCDECREAELKLIWILMGPWIPGGCYEPPERTRQMPSNPKQTYSDSDSIRCPHCGRMNGDLWDHDWRRSEVVEKECGYCDKPFTLQRLESVSYTATAIEPEPADAE